MWVKGAILLHIWIYSSEVALLSTYSKIVPMNMGRSTLIAVYDIWGKKQITLATTQDPYWFVCCESLKYFWHHDDYDDNGDLDHRDLNHGDYGFLAMVTTDHGTVYCLYFLWTFFSSRTDKAILGSRVMMMMRMRAQTVRRGGWPSLQSDCFAIIVSVWRVRTSYMIQSPKDQYVHHLWQKNYFLLAQNNSHGSRHGCWLMKISGVINEWMINEYNNHNRTMTRYWPWGWQKRRRRWQC